MTPRHDDEPLAKTLLTVVLGVGSIATTAGLIAGVAAVPDTAVRAFGLGIVAVLSVGLFLQLTRWRARPPRNDVAGRKKWAEPRTLAICGWYIGFWLFLVPSPSTLGATNVLVVAAVAVAAAISRWVLFTLCAPDMAETGTTDTAENEGADDTTHVDVGDDEPAEQAEPEPILLSDDVVVQAPRPSGCQPGRGRLRPALVVAIACVVVLVFGVGGFLDGSGSWREVMAADGSSMTSTSTTSMSAPAGSSTTVEPPPPTDPPPPTSEQTWTPLAHERNYVVCLELLERSSPPELFAAWKDALDISWEDTCPDNSAPAGDIFEYHFKQVSGGEGEYMGDSRGQGAFVWEPLATQVLEVVPDHDLDVLGGAPTPRQPCLDKGNIVVFVGPEGVPGGVAIRASKVSGGQVTRYRLIPADEFETWWAVSSFLGEAQVEFDPSAEFDDIEMPDTVDDVLALC